MPVPYATRADLPTYGIKAAALTGIDPTEQDAAVAAAIKEADGYLRGAYKLPLQSFDELLTQAVCIIAVWNLFAVEGYNPAAGTVDETFTIRYKRTIKWLEDVRDDNVDPGYTDSQDPPQQSLTGIEVVTDAPRGWGRGGSL